MKRLRRLSITPGAAIALIALFFALGGSAFAVGDHLQSPSVAQQRCTNGAVRGVAIVTGVPSQGIANMPSNFTGAANLFDRRFNCTRKAVQVRRVETGIFEVRFVGIAGASAVVSAPNDALASVQAGPNGTFSVRVYPAGIQDAADLPFTIVVV